MKRTGNRLLTVALGLGLILSMAPFGLSTSDGRAETSTDDEAPDEWEVYNATPYTSNVTLDTSGFCPRVVETNTYSGAAFMGWFDEPEPVPFPVLAQGGGLGNGWVSFKFNITGDPAQEWAVPHLQARNVTPHVGSFLGVYGPNGELRDWYRLDYQGHQGSRAHASAIGEDLRIERGTKTFPFFGVRADLTEFGAGLESGVTYRALMWVTAGGAESYEWTFRGTEGVNLLGVEEDNRVCNWTAKDFGSPSGAHTDVTASGGALHWQLGAGAHAKWLARHQVTIEDTLVGFWRPSLSYLSSSAHLAEAQGPSSSWQCSHVSGVSTSPSLQSFSAGCEWLSFPPSAFGEQDGPWTDDPRSPGEYDFQLTGAGGGWQEASDTYLTVADARLPS